MSGEARKAYERGDLVMAARIEADACERDGYDLTAAMLRELADEVEDCHRHLKAIEAMHHV